VTARGSGGDGTAGGIRAGDDAAGSAADATAVLAVGGRTSFAGFLLRLLARMPFLFLAGRLYGSAALGRFGYAILVVELTAQLATIGLKRGLADALARGARNQDHPRESAPHANTVADALLLGLLLAAAGAGLLLLWPALVFPAGAISSADRLFPLVALAVALSDISLAGLAFRHDIAAQVRARSLIEPWTLTLAAVPAFWLFGRAEGLLAAYAASMIAAAAASLWPCARSFGLPHRWRPSAARLWGLARDNAPLAGADLADWGSRRLDFFILGRFASPEVVGIYFVAQNIASLPAKLKNSFDPILGPLLATAIAAGDRASVAAHVRQVAFWVLAAQFAVVLALGMTARASLGLFGPAFVPGAAVLAVLLTAELFASQGVIAEAALIYLRPRRNLAIAAAGLVLQAALTLAFVERFGALAAAGGFAVAVGAVSVAKSLFLARVVGARVAGWRPALLVAGAGAFAVGLAVQRIPGWLLMARGTLGLSAARTTAIAEILQLSAGHVAILGTFAALIWTLGFRGPDRLLFARKAAAGR
jgi:O-antigen/teichoic acid export membrane protein